jgi:RHS repeat-associated protein
MLVVYAWVFGDGTTLTSQAAGIIRSCEVSCTKLAAGSSLLPTVVSVQAQVRANGVVIASSAPASFDDWYPLEPSLTVEISSLAYPPQGSASTQTHYTISVTALGTHASGRPCAAYATGYCVLRTYYVRPDGSAVVGGPQGTYNASSPDPLVKSQSSYQNFAPIAVYARLEIDGTPVMTSNVVSLTRPWDSESAGGCNPSETVTEMCYADPVNARTGEFFETTTDLALPGVGPAVEFTRSYSSTHASLSGVLGYGWNGNALGRIEVLTGGTPPALVRVVQPNGSIAQFSHSSGSYVSANRIQTTLARDPATGAWTFTAQDGTVYGYSAAGALQSVTDRRGNQVTYSYTSGQLSSISGSAGRMISLTWAGGKVTKATDSAGREVTYAYTGSGDLASVTAADGAVTAFAYSAHKPTVITRPGGGTVTNVYDSLNRVTSQTDELNRTTTFSRDVYGVVTITHPDLTVAKEYYVGAALVSRVEAFGTALASTTEYTYDDAMNMTAVTDALGRTQRYTYDADGNQLTATDPLGNVTARTFDGWHNVTSLVDPLNRTTTWSYDSTGDLISTTSPDMHTNSWTRNPDGSVATYTDARSMTTTHTYDLAGRPLCTTDPESREACVAYNAAGLVDEATDGEGGITAYTYDGAGRVLTVADPNGNTTTYDYDAEGNLVTVEDPLGRVTTSTFDLAGQRLSATDPEGGETSFTYTARGSLASTTDPNGAVTTYTYDVVNRLVSTSDPEGNVTEYAYDLAGQLVGTTTPSGSESTIVYDAAGRSTATTDPLGNTTTYGYDAAGQLLSVTDPLERVTSYEYTADGLLDTVTLPDSSTEAYAYDAAGNQTAYTNPDGAVTTTSYDDSGILTSRTLPGGIATAYTYDGAGRLLTVTAPDLVTSTRNYDDAGRLTAVDYPGTASDVAYAYNDDGTVHTITDITGTTTYTYDAASRVVSVEDGAAQALGYAYDDAGQLITVTYPGSRSVAYAYDDAGYMTSVTDWSSNTTTFTVTPDGLLATRADPNGITETRDYDDAGQLTGITLATTSTLAGYGYGYDDAGQLTSTTSQDALHSATTENWGYTDLSQLSTTGSSGYTTTPGGNVTATPQGDTFSYNGAQQLYAAANSNLGTSASYAYDDNGSRTQSVTSHSSNPTVTVDYGYDARQRLTSVNDGTSMVDYTYDAAGLRQTRKVGGTTQDFLWDTNNALALLVDDGDHTYIYGPGLVPIAQVDDSGEIEYLYADNVGSVRNIADDTGAITATIDYTEYGVVANTDGTANSAFGYGTGWTDSDTSLVYLRARDYDPATAQFLRVDPAVDQTRQPYAYAANDPIAVADPSGLCPVNGGPNVADCTPEDFGGNSLFLTPGAIAIGDALNSDAGRAVTSAVVGFGDGASFGLTDLLREQVGLNCYVNKDGWYAGGQIAGMVGVTVATAGVGSAGAGVTASSAVKEGIYVIRGASGTYVWQSGNLAVRLGQHAAGAEARFTAAEVANAQRIEVLGGKTAREVAEQLMIDSLGGTDRLLNIVNPIGQLRLNLMPAGYLR